MLKSSKEYVGVITDSVKRVADWIVHRAGLDSIVDWIVYTAGLDCVVD